MGRSLLQDGIITLILVACSVFCSGCGVMDDKPAQKDLSLVLAGMAGSDGVSFEGAAALLHGGKPVPESMLYYGGKVEEHNKLSLYTLLPDRSPAQKTASAESIPNLEPLGSSAQTQIPAYYSRLEKKAGKWELQPTALSAEGTENPLPALNPLRQLEELEAAGKRVTEEAGAGRGTRVLRIELTPAEAKEQLSAELEREMQAIRPSIRPRAAGSVQKGAESGRKATDSLMLFWEKKNKELQLKLKQTDIKAVYHLTVDTKRNRPKRLTRNRTVSYPGQPAQTASEIYVTEVDFYGYR